MAGNVAEALPSIPGSLSHQEVGGRMEPTLTEPLGAPGTMRMFLGFIPDGTENTLYSRTSSVVCDRKQLKLT